MDISRYSALLGVILFLFKECIKEYVLQFLSQQEEEHGCPSSLKSYFLK